MSDLLIAAFFDEPGLLAVRFANPTASDPVARFLVSRQPDSSPRAAASKVGPKRWAMAASSAASLAKCCLALSSSNQKRSMACGCMLAAIPRPPRPSRKPRGP